MIYRLMGEFLKCKGRLPNDKKELAKFILFEVKNENN